MSLTVPTEHDLKREPIDLYLQELVEDEDDMTVKELIIKRQELKSELKEIDSKLKEKKQVLVDLMNSQEVSELEINENYKLVATESYNRTSFKRGIKKKIKEEHPEWFTESEVSSYLRIEKRK